MLKAQLGGGNVGELAVEDGVKRGDFVEKGGLFFTREVTMIKEQSHRDETKVSAQQDQSKKMQKGLGFDTLCSELAMEDWAQFALVGQRDMIMPSSHDESDKPPSDEAQKRLAGGFERCTQVIGTIRKACSLMAKLSVSAATRITMTEGIGYCSDVENRFLTPLSSTLCTDVMAVSDDEIKKMLKSLAHPFAKLQQYESDVLALLKQAQRSAKNEKTKKEGVDDIFA